MNFNSFHPSHRLGVIIKFFPLPGSVLRLRRDGHLGCRPDPVGGIFIVSWKCTLLDGSLC
jgi:hypothetical protein